MPSRPPRPCVVCGTPTTNGPRCVFHQQLHDRQRNAERAHYQGTYKQQAASIRAQANADPDTICRRCGQPARPDDPWQAGHIIDGDPTSPLAPEHRSCNAGAGGRIASR